MHGFAQPEDRSSSVGAGGDPPNGGRGLDETELDSALQMLVERAQYITGATGTALALPHGEEMVCRASAGASAPAVGARLQVRSGLTGESIARRELLRCDNAETDPRVNLEACRALGIASIVVLPLLRRNGDVRGLFELFSDHPYAFEERDLIALERMADLTLTALDLAEQRQNSAPTAAFAPAPVPEAMLSVQKCASCGFPVPEGRTLCLNCEKKDVEAKDVEKQQSEQEQDASPDPAAAAAAQEEFVPAFLANPALVQESWLANHVNLLAIVVLILGILVAVVVFR